MIIDAHTHVGEWYNKFRGETCAQPLLQIMRETGIKKAVVMGSDKSSPDIIFQFVEKNRGTFYHFYFANANSKSDFLIFKTGFQNGLVDGLKIHPSAMKIRIDDQKVKPYLKFCEDHNLPVMIHCGVWQEMASYKFAIEVGKTHNGPIILAHMGGKNRGLQFECIEALENASLTNVFLETSSCYVPWILERAVSAVGDSNVLFGSDFPFYHPGVTLETLKFTELSNRSKEKILSRNIRRLCDGKKA